MYILYIGQSYLVIGLNFLVSFTYLEFYNLVACLDNSCGTRILQTCLPFYVILTPCATNNHLGLDLGTDTLP